MVYGRKLVVVSLVVGVWGGIQYLQGSKEDRHRDLGMDSFDVNVTGRVRS